MLFMLFSLCWIFQLSEGVSVESEGLFWFSACVIKGHLRDVLIPVMTKLSNEMMSKCNEITVI